MGEKISQSKFGAVEYTDKKGEIRQMYEMTKDGFVLLTMGYTTPDNLGVRQRQMVAGRVGGRKGKNSART